MGWSGTEWEFLVLFFFSYSKHLTPICDFVDCVSRNLVVQLLLTVTLLWELYHSKAIITYGT